MGKARGNQQMSLIAGAHRSRTVSFRILLFMALLFCGIARAQTLPGTVRGEVFSVAPNDERYLIPGAEVVLIPIPGAHPQGQPAQSPMESATDATGTFVFENVPSGCYRASASSAGLTGERDEICLLAPGGTVNLAIEMKVAAIRESVEVSARAEGIETTETSATGGIESSTLKNAPNADERFESLLPLLPGVVRGPDGLINMKGARSTQSGALVNSANVTDPVTGGSAINLPIDVIASVKVLSNPYDAEYGKFAGAISTVNTQVSDFNKFHYKFQNFLPRLRKRDGAIMGIEAATPRLTLSGPLVPGRVAVTQSVQYRFVRNEIENAGLPPLERDTALESFDSFTQVDLQISDRHTAGVTLSFFPQKQNYFGLNTFTPQPATPDLRQRGYMLSFQDMYAFNSGALFQSRVSFKTFDGNVKAHGSDLFRVGIETAEGAFFNRQDRESFRFEVAEIYNFAPHQAHGLHLLKVGFGFDRNTYDGRQLFDTVEILGVSDTLIERSEFGAPAVLDVDQNEYTFFVHDKWRVWSRLTLDFGVRFDHDSITDDNHLAPRLGFAYALTKDNRTLLRGGAGLFYDRVNLNIPTFLDLPERTVSRFSSTGVLLERRLYRHRLARAGNDLRNPLSTAWNLQLVRELVPSLFLRVGYQQRNTTRNFLLNPETTQQGDFLTLSNSGRDRYREFEITSRYRLGSSTQLTASYVRSSAIGDLNDFNTIFGTIAEPVIRPNERSRLPFDAPNRFLFWADLSAPYKITISPVLDIHSGFPFSVVNEQRDFLGSRNRAGRFPRFATFDLQVLKQVTIPFGNKKFKARVGVRLFNLFNSFNPQDIQDNLASPRFGTFFNSKDRQVRGKFVIDF